MNTFCDNVSRSVFSVNSRFSLGFGRGLRAYVAGSCVSFGFVISAVELEVLCPLMEAAGLMLEWVAIHNLVHVIPYQFGYSAIKVLFLVSYLFFYSVVMINSPSIVCFSNSLL